jgi:hypothetical protein
MKQRSHAVIDRINATQDRVIASKLRRDARVLIFARQNLRRWMAGEGRTVRPVFLEWDRILRRLTRTEIAAFLVSETPMARRLRQSTPFAGVLKGRERLAIRQAHEKAGA